MKDQKKDKKNAKEVPSIELSIDESIGKYAGSEFASPKLEKAEKKFSKQVIHN